MNSTQYQQILQDNVQAISHEFEVSQGMDIPSLTLNTVQILQRHSCRGKSEMVFLAVTVP